MESQNWNRVKQIFQEAAELSPAEREVFLDRACAGNKDVRAEVETLLAAHDGGGDLLQSPTASLPESLPAEGPGTVIGRYKLLQLIGEGGFGSVYMAEQERPVRRKVALKIIKLGMDTKQVIARFEAERQALALMDHPNIARVLDAGATETGRPYFVMELVRGIPITKYCDQNNLTTRERLELFQSVCSAVQHAHQKGIIHRDIKPSNVMVTLHDGVPVPKVIDFGIAKATNQRLTEKTLFTEYHQFVGTPQYMSPEQAEMSGLDVDTRTDIYALGVLLYELLTGTTPFDPNRLRGMAYSEIHRVIREEEPDKPSTRVSTLGEAATDTAKSRATDVGTLRRTLSGDLDWIVMRAIEKDRTRRYDTANSLRLDIERHLRNEPVLASPPSAPYRVRKFVRRNRTAVLVFGAVAATLVVGIAFATFGFVEASRERAVARREAEAATAINAFFTDMLASLNPKPEDGWLSTPTLGGDSDARNRKDVSVAEMLREATERIEGSFEDKPLLEAQARETIARTLLGLGAKSDALEQFEKVLEIRRRVLGEKDREVLRSRLLVVGTLSALQRANAAVGMAGKVASDLERYLGKEDPLTLFGLSLYASVRMAQGNFASVDSIYEVTLERQRRVLGSNHRDTIATLISWTQRHCWSGNGPEATKLASEAFERARETYGPEDPLTQSSEVLYAFSMTFMHRFAEAQAILRRAWERIEPDDPEDPRSGLLGFAFLRSLDADNELDEKEGLLREHFEKLRQEGQAGSGANWVGSHDYGLLLVRRGKVEEALGVYREVHEFWSAARDTVESGLTQGRTDFIRNLVAHRYQSLLAIAGKWNEVRAMERDRLAELRAHAREAGAGAHEWNSYAWALLTCETTDLRDPEEALQWATRAVAALENGEPILLAQAMDTQAKALELTGAPEKAFDIETRALELCESAENDDATAALLPALVRYATLVGRHAQGEETVRRIVEGIIERHGAGSTGAANALREVGDALAFRGFHDWAEATLRRSVAEARRLGDEEVLLTNLNALVRSRARAGHPEEAEALVDEAIGIYRNLYVGEPIDWTPGMGRTVEGERSQKSLSFKTTLAHRLLEVGRVEEAGELLHQLQCAQSAIGSAYLKGRFLLAEGDAEGALPLLRLALYRSRLADDIENEPGDFARREGEYGHCLSVAGRHEEGEAVLLRAYDRAMEWCGPESAHVDTLALWITELYKAWGKHAEAAKWRDRGEGRS